MNSLEEHKSILIKEYGYWPEFCDSKITSINFNFKEKLAVLCLVYTDVDLNKTRNITFSMEGVTALDMNQIVIDNNIDLLELNKVDNAFKMSLDSSSGVSGDIIFKNLSIEIN